MVYFDQKRMRAAVMDMVNNSKPNVFLTFSFGHPHRATRHPVGRHPGWHPIPSHAIHARVRDFIDRLEAAVEGVPIPGARAFGFLESASVNPHMHVLVNLDSDQIDWLEERGKAVWRKLSNNGQLHVEETKHPVKVLSYCTKRFTDQKAFENMFIH
jgi:hypothetical protein